MLRGGGGSGSTLAVTGTAAVGDLIVATSATTGAYLNDVALGSVLASQGVGVAPAYSSSPKITITGTSTNDNAASAIVGEIITATIATGASVALTTAATSTVTSISLTAGDWDVDGVVDYTFGATTSFTALKQGIATVAATLGAQDSFTSLVTAAQVPTAALDMALTCPTIRVSLAGTTTVYLVAQGTFTVSTLKGYGTIRARRVR